MDGQWKICIIHVKFNSQIQYPNNEWLLLRYRYYIPCDIMAFINVLHYNANKKQFKFNSLNKKFAVPGQIIHFLHS